MSVTNFIAGRHGQPDERSRVQVFKQAPMPALRPFIKHFLVVEFSSPEKDTHLPEACPVAAFSFRGECRIDGGERAPLAAFTGPRETLRAHEHRDGHAVLLATFTPAGASALLRPPLDEFTGTTTDLRDILGRSRELDFLREQLIEARNHTQRVRFLEDFLRARFRLAEPDPLVAAAIAWLESEGPIKRIDDLAQHIGLSQSALERRFRRVVGLSPKRFSSVVRLRRAVRLRQAGADLASVAHAAGYFDQSHFINHFRRAIGSAPNMFFRQLAAD
jgi:AraC-like DNA-binding protein